MPLADDVIVYPAHGAGSACGKNLSSETWGYLGDQKKTNYALRPDMTKEEFVEEVTAGLMPPPQYFAKNAMMNKSGYESFDEVLERGAVALDPETFEQLVETQEALMLDTRSAADFAKSHIPNSIFIGIDGSFAPWVGALITDIRQAIVLITPEGREEEVVTRLARVGYDNTLGYLKGGIKAWRASGKEIDQIESISPEVFAERLSNGEAGLVLDVRKPTEFLAHHVQGATNVPLDYVNRNMEKLNREQKYALHCAGGYRSMIMASILQARGFQNLINIEKGFKGIEENGEIPLSAYTCPSTMSQEAIDKAVSAVI